MDQQFQVVGVLRGMDEGMLALIQQLLVKIDQWQQKVNALNAAQAAQAQNLGAVGTAVNAAAGQINSYNEKIAQTKAYLDNITPGLSSLTSEQVKQVQATNQAATATQNATSATAAHANAVRTASGAHSQAVVVVNQHKQAHEGLMRQMFASNDALAGISRGIASATMQIPLMTGLWVAFGREIGQVLNTAKEQAADLLDSVNKLASINPQFNMGQGSAELIGISSRTAIGIKQVADAEYLLTDAANRSQKQTADLTEAVSKASYVFQVNDSVVAKAAEGGIQAWRLQLSDITKLFDQWSIVLANGNITAEDLLQNYNRLAVSSRNLNMNAAELTAAIADNSRAGDVDSRTMTALDNLFTHMNTDKFRAGLDTIKVSMYDGNGQLKSFTALMTEVNEKIKTMTATEQADFWAKLAPDMRTRRGLMEFFQNFDQTYIPTLKKAEEAYSGVTGAMSRYDQTSQRILDSDKARADQWGAKWNATLAGVGQAWFGLMGFLNDVSEAIAKNRDRTDAYNLVLQKMGTDSFHASQGQKDVANTLVDNADRIDTMRTSLDAMAGSWENASAEQAKAAESATIAAQPWINSYIAMGQAAQEAQQTQANSYQGVAQQAAQSYGDAQNALANYQSSSQTILRQAAEDELNLSDNTSAAAAKRESAHEEAKRVIQDQLTQLQKAVTDLETQEAALADNAGAVDLAHSGAMNAMKVHATAEIDALIAKLNELINKEREVAGLDFVTLPARDPNRQRQQKRDYDDWFYSTYGYDPADYAGYLARQKREAAAAESAAKKADTAADSQRSADAHMVEYRAKEAVAAVQAHINEQNQKYNDLLDELKAKLEDTKEAHQGALFSVKAAWDDAKAALENYKEGMARLFNDLEAQMHPVEETIKKMQADMAQALAWPGAVLQHAKKALDDLNLETQKQDNIFAQQAHALSDQMYDIEQREQAAIRPLQDLYTAQEDALYKLRQEADRISETYDSKLLPLQRELSELQQQDTTAQHVKDLHDQALAIDNLRARMATMTVGSAEWIAAQGQATEAQNRYNRTQREYSISEQIAKLEEMKQAELDIVNEKIKTAEKEAELTRRTMELRQREFDREKRQIADQQVLLQKQQAEYDYAQEQKRIAAEQAVRDAQKAYDQVKTIWENQIANQQNILNTLKTQYDETKYAYEQQVLAMQQTVDWWNDNYTTLDNYWKGIEQDINNTITTTNNLKAQAQHEDDPVLKYWQNIESQLSKAYGVVEQIDSAADKGGKLTSEQATALASAKKTIEELTPLVPPLGVAYTDLASAVKTASTDSTTATKNAFDSATVGSVPDMVSKGLTSAKNAAVAASKKDDPNTLAGAQTLFLTDLTTQYQELFGEKPTDPTKNATKLFNTGLDNMYKHLREAWAPNTKTEFQSFFTAVSDMFSQNLASWLKEWQDTMNQMTPPSWTNPTNPTNPTTPAHNAAGGIVWQPTLSWLAEDEPEVVIPFSKLGLGSGPYFAGGGMGGAQYNNVSVLVKADELPQDLTKWRRVGKEIGIVIMEEMNRNGRHF